MDNCFVTKITDSIPNDATHNPMLHKMNEFVIKAKPLMSGEIIIPSISSHNSTITIDVLGKGTLHSNINSRNSYQDFTINSLDDLYLKVSDVDNVNMFSYITYEKPNGIAFDINTLGSCLNLTYLFLTTKNVTGNISNLSNLINLTELNVSNTSITGNISNLSNLINLTTLTVNNTSITGDISNISNLINLTTLNVRNTSITGNISNISNLINLTELNVSNTSITGNISNLSNLINLTTLTTKDSSITGDIKTLAKLTKLVEINTSNCALSGTIESLANEIAKAKVAHVLKIWTLGGAENKCTITYNGNKAVKRVWTITFAADGTYTVENTDS